MNVLRGEYFEGPNRVLEHCNTLTPVACEHVLFACCRLAVKFKAFWASNNGWLLSSVAKAILIWYWIIWFGKLLAVNNQHGVLSDTLHCCHSSSSYLILRSSLFTSLCPSLLGQEAWQGVCGHGFLQFPSSWMNCRSIKIVLAFSSSYLSVEKPWPLNTVKSVFSMWPPDPKWK